MGDPVPMKLYKYRGITPYSLADLTNHELHASSPLAFNDPYDCLTQQPGVDASASDIRDFLNKYGVDHFLDLNDAGFRGVRAYDQTGDAEALHEELRNVLLKERNDVLSDVRICSLSAIKNGLVMWSHYGDQHTGMCLEFDATQEPFVHAKKVEYGKQMPEFDFMKAYMDGDYSDLVRAQFHKFSGWQSEGEWRIVRYGGPDSISYYMSALTAVYLGSRVDDALARLVESIVAEFPERPEVYRLVLDDERYELNGNRVSLYGYMDAYGDDMEAQQHGL